MEETLKKGTEEIKGALYQSLSRNSKDILKDRAETISEDLEMTFKRGVEDIAAKLKRLNRERNNMYDFSPSNTQSLVLAKDLDSRDILAKDTRLSIDIRQVEIELEIAQKRFEFLFGKPVTI
jgi:hypothetical protein